MGVYISPLNRWPLAARPQPLAFHNLWLPVCVCAQEHARVGRPSPVSRRCNEAHEKWLPNPGCSLGRALHALHGVAFSFISSYTERRKKRRNFCFLHGVARSAASLVTAHHDPPGMEPVTDFFLLVPQQISANMRREAPPRKIRNRPPARGRFGKFSGKVT